MNHKLMTYVITISSILSFSLFFILGFYTSFFDALGTLIGTLWGCINFYFLKRLLKIVLKMDFNYALKLYTMIGIKFPFLYFIGYEILKIKLFPILYLVVGFSLIFVAIFLLGVGTLFSSKLQTSIGSKTS